MEKQTTVSEAVHKLQLALLEGIQDDNLLFAAASLLSKYDYNDVVTERTIAKLCGYPLCPNLLPADRPKKGQYHISIKEHKVYDLHETYLYCCSNCLINSKAFGGSLKEDRRSDFNAAKVDDVLRLFDDVEVGRKEELNSNILVIKENVDVAANGREVVSEDWGGPSNAVEGYVPRSDRRKGNVNALMNEGSDGARNEVDFEGATSSREVLIDDKSYQVNDSQTMGFLPSDVNFKSMIITNNDELTAPKELEGGSKSGRSGVKKGLKAKKSVPKKGNDSIFGAVDFMSTIITQDEYSVSKLPSGQVVSDPNQLSQEFSKQLSLGDAEMQSKLSEVSACPVENGGPQTSVDSAVIRAEQNVGSSEITPHHDQNDASSSRRHVKDESSSEKAVHSSKLKSKSSLKNSGVKKVSRSVSWADEKINGLAGGNLCEFSEFKETKEAPRTLKGKEAAINDDSQRFASAEACAKALIEAAEAVASGQSDANDAVSKAGIIVLPQPESAGQGEKSVIDDALEDVAPEKWPNKPGNSNSEAFDPDNSWIDGAPEGFSLTLSPFALMWDALFSWLTSSSLAFIYGREESLHVEYMSVNGREYPCKAVLPDGLSLEIKQTLAGCLSRALDELTADLKLPTRQSTVQHQLNFLLDTMSFMDALPPFRMKQWQVIALLFIDALSVCRIPGLAGHLTSRRVLFAQVLNGAQISAEEYEIMKDLMIPLGRVPQFSMQSGG